jgi:hypothetical protein
MEKPMQIKQFKSHLLEEPSVRMLVRFETVMLKIASLAIKLSHRPELKCTKRDLLKGNLWK